MAAGLGPAVADACSAFGLEELLVDTSLADKTAPDAVGEADVAIKRGRAPVCRLGTCESSSCDGSGSVQLTFDPPKDDQSASDAIGYRIELVDGEAPEGLIPDFAFRTFDTPGSISLDWADGDTDDQEELELTIVIYAVDQAGNESAPSPEITIFDPGSKAGCSAGGRSSAGWWLLALPMLGFAARRRLRR